MARTARAKLSPQFSFSSLLGDIKEWANQHPDEVRIGAVGAAFAFFFTHGLPLYDQDYSRWLAQGDGGFFALLGRVLLPFTSEPQTWGYADRPVEVLMYKLMSLVFGTWGTGYFLVKSLAFGALIGTMYHWMTEKLELHRNAAYVALAVFATSANALAALLWHSDFTVYSQLGMAILFLWALPQIDKGPSSINVYKKGWKGLPQPFARFLIVFFVAVYFGAKLQGDFRLAPPILAAYLYLFRREKFDVYWAPLGITFLATLPWSADFFKHLPPFLGGAGYQGTTYGAFSPAQVFNFVAGDLFSWRSAPLSLLGGMGLLVALAAAAYLGFRVYREKLGAPDRTWGLFLIWAGFGVLSLGILPANDPNASLAYAMLPMIPLAFVLALAMHAAFKEFGRIKWFGHAVWGVLALQILMHLAHDYGFRKNLGHTMVAVDQLFHEMETKHANAQLLFAPGFVAYGYKASTAPVIAGRKPLEDFAQIDKYPVNGTYVASWESSLDMRYTLDDNASGCGASLFDLIAPCKSTEGAMVLKYVGAPGEIAQATTLEKQGNVAGALQQMDAYLQREPNNHGAHFVAGLYAYRLGNMARMEQSYNVIGPYFPYYPSVIYNWALAKEGIQKYAEASALFERAYAMVPRDYAIGFNLADSYFQQGKKSRALATMDELMKNYPDNKTLKTVYETWKSRN